MRIVSVVAIRIETKPIGPRRVFVGTVEVQMANFVVFVQIECMQRWDTLDDLVIIFYHTGPSSSYSSSSCRQCVYKPRSVLVELSLVIIDGPLIVPP